MRILFISPVFPMPVNNGYKMRIWGWLRSLAGEGHKVGLLSFAEPQELNANHRELQRVCQSVEIVPLELTSLSGSVDVGGRLWSLLSALPYSVTRYRSSRMRAAAVRLLREERYDAVVCETPYAAVNLPEPLPVPLILDDQNLEYVLIERYLRCEQNPLKWAYGWLEHRKLKAWEQRACRQGDMVTVCSGHDRVEMQELCPGTRVAVVPNIVEVGTYAPTPNSDGSTILYTGGMDWFPNRDAVEFFITAILPELRKRIPRVKFVIAGRSAPEKFRSRFTAIEGIEFTGTVLDMRPVLASASVCVVPLRIGSGTRFKILEAAASGKPTVSTRVGAEGLEFINGEEIILQDEPKAFAQAVGDLLSDPGRRRAMGLAARRRVEEDYSLAKMQRLLDQAMSELFGEHLTSDAKACAEGGMQ